MENIISISERVEQVDFVPIGVGDAIKLLMDESDFYSTMKILKYNNFQIKEMLDNTYDFKLTDLVLIRFATKKPVFYFENIQREYKKEVV